jgi:hypothetical protein
VHQAQTTSDAVAIATEIRTNVKADLMKSMAVVIVASLAMTCRDGHPVSSNRKRCAVEHSSSGANAGLSCGAGGRPAGPDEETTEMRILRTLAVLALLGFAALAAGSHVVLVDQAHAGCTPGRDC